MTSQVKFEVPAEDTNESGPSPASPSSTYSKKNGEGVSTVAPSTDDEPSWPYEWRAYLTLTGCFFLMFNSWGVVNAFGTFASYYKEHLMPGRPLLLMNLIGSTESFIVLSLSGVVGRLLDAGYTKFILPTGAALVTLGMFLLSISSTDGRGGGKYTLIWTTQGLVTGLGMACFFVASSQIAVTWFPKRRSFAVGVVASGASIAGLVYPFMIKELISEHGWTKAVQSTAGLTAATAFFSAVTAVPNPKHPLNKNSPYPWLSIRRWVDPPAFRNNVFNWFCLAIAFMFFGFYAVFFDLEEWALAEGLGTKGNSVITVNNPGASDDEPEGALQTFIYLSIMNGSSTIGRIGSGYLSDKFGALEVHLVVMFVSSMLLFFLWTFAKTVASAMAFVIIFGAFSGAVIGMPPATIAYIITHDPDVDHSRQGHWTGMMYTMASPFALTGPVIAGYLVSKYNNNFITVQMWSGTNLLLASCCIGAALYCVRRKKAQESSRGRLRNSISKLFDMESGPATAADSTAVTRDPSTSDEKDKRTSRKPSK